MKTILLLKNHDTLLVLLFGTKYMWLTFCDSTMTPSRKPPRAITLFSFKKLLYADLCILSTERSKSEGYA